MGTDAAPTHPINALCRFDRGKGYNSQVAFLSRLSKAGLLDIPGLTRSEARAAAESFAR